MNEIVPGLWHWTARHPKIGFDVSSYYVAGPAVLIDPMLPPEGIAWLGKGGSPREILLTNRHHDRDSAAIVEAFGCTVRVSRPGLHELADRPFEAVPFDFGDELAGGIVAYEVGAICPDETALHLPAERALACADGVVNWGDGKLAFVPDTYMDDPERTKRELREAYARLAAELEFDVLLLAHGAPIVSGGREALRAFATAE